MRTLRLKKDVRASIDAGHPWIYRDALQASQGEPGELVEVIDRDGSLLAVGYLDEGVIGVRIVARKRRELEGDVMLRRVQAALAQRTAFLDRTQTTAFRWVNGEADQLPGVNVDVYAGWAVVRFDGLGAERWASAIVPCIVKTMPELRGVLLRKGRGETKDVRVVHGEEPPALVVIHEHGMKLHADLRHGQKTGLFLDHRESRKRIRDIAKGRSVLNLYGYTGGFSIAAGLGGAREVSTVDVAREALLLAEKSWAENGLLQKHTTHCEDVPKFLERVREEGKSYDLIVGDPPSFAPNEAAVPNAMRAYRSLHRACLRLLRPGGIYLAASCSSHVDRERFDRTIREAVEKVPRHVRVLERWGGAADHPRLPAFPEGDYLKNVLLSVGE